MVKLTVLYGRPDDPEAFEEYYANTHMPMVPKIPNLLRYEAARVVGTPEGGEPPYYRIFEGYFEDMESLQALHVHPRGAGAARGPAELRHQGGDDPHLRDRRVSHAAPVRRSF